MKENLHTIAKKFNDACNYKTRTFVRNPLTTRRPAQSNKILMEDMVDG